MVVVVIGVIGCSSGLVLLYTYCSERWPVVAVVVLATVVIVVSEVGGNSIMILHTVAKGRVNARN